MAYTTPDEVAVLLRRPLTDADRKLVEALVGPVDALLDAAIRDSGQDPASMDPAILSYVAGDIIKTSLLNDPGVSQESDTAGPYARSVSYSNPLSQLFITAAHRKLLGITRGKSGAQMRWGAL